MCQRLKNARYDATLKDPLTGKERKVRFKTLHKLLGLVTYLDWVMIMVTTLTTCSMMLETPQDDGRPMKERYLQVRFTDKKSKIFSRFSLPKIMSMV